MELQARLGSMSGNTKEGLKKVYDHVFRLEEELRYLLTNLDVTNFNDLELARYENGRMQLYAKALEIRASKLKAEFEAADGRLKTELDASISGIRSTVTEQGYSISSLSQTASKIQTTVQNQGDTINNMQSSITQNADNITAIVTNVGSGGKVTAASIVAAINAAESTVQISADHIKLTGFVTVEDLKGEGTTEINGSNIKSGTIEGVIIKSTGKSWGTVIIQDAVIGVGTGSMYNDTVGTTYIKDDTAVCIRVGTLGRYWKFETTGIYWCESDGTVINQVLLKG